jgi:hypothetical protein
MKTILEIVKRRLFDKDAMATSNIKLYPGSSRDATPAQMGEQINKALAQIEAGDYELVEQFED